GLLPRPRAAEARARSGGDGKQLGRRDAVATWGRRSEQRIDFGFPGEDRFATSTICVAVLGNLSPALAIRCGRPVRYDVFGAGVWQTVRGAEGLGVCEPH